MKSSYKIYVTIMLYVLIHLGIDSVPWLNMLVKIWSYVGVRLETWSYVEFGGCLVPKSFAIFLRFPAISNLLIHA